MITRFATFALFAALTISPALAQDAGEDHGGAAGKPTGDRAEALEKENRADRKQAEPGAPGGRIRQPPVKPIPPPVVIAPPEMTAALPADARIFPLEDGFALLESGAAGDRFVARDKDGKGDSELFAPGHKVDAWWLSADGKRLLWTSGGRMYTAKPGAKTMDSLGGAPLGAPALSPDGGRVAFVRDGRVVVRSLEGSEEKEFPAGKDLLLGGGAAWSLDGNKIFTLVGPAANEPDGIGSVDLTGEAPSVSRIYTATNATLSSLSLASTGKWLLFVQTTKSEPKQAALRLFAPDGSEFRTLARASEISDPAFSPDGQHAYFAARGMAGGWQAWEAGLEAESGTGEIALRQIVAEENRQFVRPVVGRDANQAWFIRWDAEGKGAQVGRVKLK